MLAVTRDFRVVAAFRGDLRDQRSALLNTVHDSTPVSSKTYLRSCFVMINLSAKYVPSIGPCESSTHCKFVADLSPQTCAGTSTLLSVNSRA